MNARYLWTLWCLTLFPLLCDEVPTASAGEVVSCFSQGQLGLCSRPVLQHLEFKSVVLQFVDPKDTGLGESLSRLLWREILESIFNLAGAGVILAYDRQDALKQALGDRDYRAFLESEYHAAAASIARQLGTQISLWGVVLPDGDALYIQPFVTLHREETTPWTALSMRLRGPSDVVLGAQVATERLNFAPSKGTRRDLFSRLFTTRCAKSDGCPGGIALHAKSSNDSPVIARIPAGSEVMGRGMQQQWLEIERPDSSTAFINIYHLEVFPRLVTFAGGRSVNLRARPNTGAPVAATVALAGDYQVLHAVRGAGKEPWYYIRAGDREGWVAHRLIERRSYSFPAVYLIAGLYRYGRGDYTNAIKEFEAFLARAPNEDNVTRAAALQFLAASRVAQRTGSERGVEQAIAALDRAAALTPFDPGVYTLRSVIRLGTIRQLDAGLADIQEALRLDPQDEDARRLLGDLVSAAGRTSLHIFAPGQDIRSANATLHKLSEHYLQPR